MIDGSEKRNHQLAFEKNFATAVETRKTSRVYLVLVTVIPIRQCQTLVALQTIPCETEEQRRIIANRVNTTRLFNNLRERGRSRNLIWNRS